LFGFEAVTFSPQLNHSTSTLDVDHSTNISSSLTAYCGDFAPACGLMSLRNTGDTAKSPDRVIPSKHITICLVCLLPFLCTIRHFKFSSRGNSILSPRVDYFVLNYIFRIISILRTPFCLLSKSICSSLRYVRVPQCLRWIAHVAGRPDLIFNLTAGVDYSAEPFIHSVLRRPAL